MRAWIVARIAALVAAGACSASLERRPGTPPPSPSPPPTVAPAAAPRALGAVRPWIGVSLGAGAHGARVKLAIDQTPGARAGLRPDDEILALDGEPTASPADLIARVQAKGVGARVTLRVWRAGAELEVPLALEARPDAVEILHRKLVGKPAPGFALADAVGPHPAALADLAGKVVVVEFGATWCGFCMSTLPRLDAWQARWRDAGLRVVWVSSEPWDTIRRLDPSDQLGFTRARDPDDALAARYFVPALPTLVVIGRDGVVRAAEMGAGETVDEIEGVIAKLLAAP